MKTNAKIIADSCLVNGAYRITTMEVTLHRFVLAEFNTHRAFSRNSASSRAIPIQKQLDRIDDSPALPLSHPKEHKGMQGGDELEGDDLIDAQNVIRDILAFSTDRIQEYVWTHESEHRLHKSVLNRYLEPFMWHTIVVTSTEWDNFFKLRCSPMAQPEMRAAAECMRTAYESSLPIGRSYKNGAFHESWHLPYVTQDERSIRSLNECQIMSVARCARVSSLHAGDVNDFDADERLYHQLISANPMHASPLEHQADTCMLDELHDHANFEGWHQLRHAGDKP